MTPSVFSMRYSTFCAVVANGDFYPNVIRTGKSVYNKWRYWNSKGRFNKIHSFLLENARRKCGRDVSPTICFIDSASRRSGLSDSVKGVDGFKKSKGVKRHLFVDSQGNILHAHTTCANINGGKACLEMITETKRRYPSLKEMRKVTHVRQSAL